MRRTQLLILFFILSYTITATGQIDNALYPYYADDSIARAALLKTIANSYKSNIVPPDNEEKGVKKDFTDIRNDNLDMLSARLKRRLVLDTVVLGYLKTITEKIYLANPGLKDFHIVLIDDPIPNASAIGDGTIIINVGLLPHIYSEEDLVYVICHEIAHMFLDHIRKHIIDSIHLKRDKELRRKVRELLSEEYDRSSKLNAFFTKIALKDMHHNRHYETQADSMAYLFMIKTPYRSDEAHLTLKLLDSIDQPVYSKLFDFKQLFSCIDHPLDLTKRTTTNDAFLSIKTDSAMLALRDSLKSHPDAKARSLFIKQMMSVTKPPVRESVPAKQFSEMKYRCELESIEGWFKHEYYGLALYYALIYKQQYPENEYINAVIFICMAQIHRGFREHNLSYFFDRRSKRFPDNYNQFLDFINDSRKSEIMNILDCLYPKASKLVKSDEYHRAIEYLYNNEKGKTQEAEAIKKEYRSKYPKGRLRNIF